MLKIELNPSADPAERYGETDLGLRVSNNPQGLQPDDVMSFYTCRNCNTPRSMRTFPKQLVNEISRKLPEGISAMLGNAGCEVTFRHIAGKNARKNVNLILQWAKEAYDILGDRLVLAPMDMDIIHDVMTGSRLLEWAGKKKIPLCIFCGFRFLFTNDAFDHIKNISASFPFDDCGNPYEFPYDEISHAIRGSGAQVWTGAGFHEGLQAGVLQLAEEFGFSGVLTKKEAWLAGLQNGN